MMVQTIHQNLTSPQTNTLPNSYRNSEWVCSSYGKDTCSIHRDDISASGMNIHFGGGLLGAAGFTYWFGK